MRRGRSLPSLATALLGLAALSTLPGCPRESDEHLRKANVYFSTGDLDRAATAYEAAAASAPQSAEAREGRGNVAFERERFAEAQSWYEQAIAAQPGAITAHHKRALALAAQGKLTEAIEGLRAALVLAPDNPYAHSTIGGFLAKQGDLEGAEKAQIAALHVDPEYHAARYALANVQIDLGRLDDADAQLARLSSKGPKALAEYGLARLAARRGDAAAVARHLGRVLEGEVSAPARIPADPVFAGVWDRAELAPVRARLEALGVRTSSSSTTTGAAAAP